MVEIEKGAPTFHLIEERLIEAAACWRRAPGVAAPSARATDGPWHLITKDWGDLLAALEGGHDIDARLRTAALTREEIGRRDEASGWIEAHVAEAGDRRIVWMALFHKADGRQPDWAWIMRQAGLRMGRDGVRMRYTRAVGGIVRALDRMGAPVAWAGI